MRIAVVVGEFPELSSTFILDNITGLLDQGHDVHIFARRPIQKSPIHADHARYALAARTHYWWGSTRETLARAALLIRRDPTHNGGRLLRSLDFTRHGSHALFGRWFSYAAALLSEPPFDVVLAQFGTNGRIAEMLRRIGVFDAPIATTWLGYDLSRIIEEKGTDHYRRLLASGELQLPLSAHFKERLLKLSCPPERIAVHHVGVDTKRFAFAPRALAPGEPVRILTVCRLVEKKGIEFALRALAQVAERGVDFRYDLVGNGPLRTRLERLCAELALGDRVTLHGEKAREEVAGLLARSHLFLSPSVKAHNGDEEGVPAAIKEAMAVGLPVVSTHHAAIPEVVRDGVTGFLVPERDVSRLAARLLQLIRAPECWAEMGKQGRRVIEEEYDLASLNRALSEHLLRIAAAYPRNTRVALGQQHA
jgi:colanic acid/amylovoran biosynthesis glycosyltransferase